MTSVSLYADTNTAPVRATSSRTFCFSLVVGRRLDQMRAQRQERFRFARGAVDGMCTRTPMPSLAAAVAIARP